MKIEWKQIDDNQIEFINGWLSLQDKQNLCMTEKSWQQTAIDIEDCLKIMDNAQFVNIIGYVKGAPVVALMFGVEHIKVLNLYNIVVNPYCRRMGVAKKVVSQLLKNDQSLCISRKFNKVVSSVLPGNKAMIDLFDALGFTNLGFDGEYVVFEKEITKQAEQTK